MLRRLGKAAALIAAIAFAPPSWSACQGPNLIDALDREDRARLEERIARHPYPEGNLWRAEKGGSTVHVVGTVHIPDPRLRQLADRVSPFLLRSDLLILEATAAMESELRNTMVTAPEIAFITEGPTLIDLLGDEIWDALKPELTERGVPPFLAAKFRPWLLTMTLSIPVCAIEDVMSGKTGLDGMIEAEAERLGLPIATLDDPKAILDLLNEGSMDQQIEMLKVMVLTEQNDDAIFATTLDSYFEGRHRELFEFSRLLAEESGMKDAAQSFAAFEEALLDRRNRRWAPEIARLVDGRDAVIAVGAAHLSGETGVLKALERMGYRLTRL